MSDVHAFPRDGHVPQRPGSWVRRHGITTLTCPLCGAGVVLDQVLVDGTLPQTVSCPGGDFSGTVRLAGWEP